MNRIFFFAASFISIFFIGIHTSRAQNSKTDSVLIGSWKGTSLCQIKNSPCHDETVVYHISKGKTANAYIIRADKIVNGVEEDMGILNFTWDADKMELHSTDYNSDWIFKLDNKQLHGRLISRNSLYRIIELSKQ